jgi:hypothetical protein
MSAVARRVQRSGVRVTLKDKPLPEPEAVNAKAHPMTGFFAGLSEDQKKAALAYKGDENHGDPAFRYTK